MIIFVGVSAARGTQADPMGFEPRKQMLQTAYPNATILPIADNPSNKVWSEDLDRQIDIAAPGAEITLVSGPNGFIRNYCGKHQVSTVDKVDSPSGTDIRKSLKDTPIDSSDFRAGMIHAAFQRRPAVIPTVDIALYRFSNIFNYGKQEKKLEFLFGQRPGTETWRFPGGFAEISDVDWEDTAWRELEEETGYEVGGLENLRYIGGATVNDWRYTGPDAKIRTVLFAVNIKDCSSHEREAEFSNVKWMTLDEAASVISKEHEVLRILLLRRVDRLA